MKRQDPIPFDDSDGQDPIMFDDSDEESSKLDKQLYFKYRDSPQRQSHSSGEILVQYLTWSFRTSFFWYIVSAVLLFFVQLLLFTAVIYVYAKFAPDECIEGGDSSSNTLLAHSFGLSWTTFSTVGYGHTYPTLNDACAFTTIVASFESFVGVLYAGFCGAVLFGKVNKLFADAMVIFSDHYVIRYEDGVDIDEDDDDFEDDASEDLKPNVSPFPVLVFRIVNALANRNNYGDIVNLSLSATAVVKVDTQEEAVDSHKKSPRRSYNLKLGPSAVPLFRAVIYVEHKLDLSSPLLTRAAKNDIKENGDKWPFELNNVNLIRESIDFEELVVTLEGTSDITKSTVIGQKKYLREGRIGWQFAPMSYIEEKTDKTRVKFELLNDLVEQKAGDGEKLEGGNTKIYNERDSLTFSIRNSKS